MSEPSGKIPPLMASLIAAGFPSPAEQYIESPLNLNELLVHKPAAIFFVRADGDSMTGAGIQSSDILVADRSLEADAYEHIGKRGDVINKHKRITKRDKR